MVEQKSMIETAVGLLKRKRNPQKFNNIYKEVSETLGFSDEDMQENIARFYNDLSLSALFIYTGSNEWDLKERQPIELWDKDASHFIDPDEIKEKKSIRQKEKVLAAKKEEERIEKLRLQDAPLEEEDLTVEEVLAELEEVPQKEVPQEQVEVESKDKPVKAEKKTKDKKDVSKKDGEGKVDLTEELEIMGEKEYTEYMDDYEELYEEKKK